jgi:hypothetical protein
MSICHTKEMWQPVSKFINAQSGKGENFEHAVTLVGVASSTMHSLHLLQPPSELFAGLTNCLVFWDAETAVNDVDVINLWMDGGGAFALLASAAATIKYLMLKKQPAKVKVQKKVS